MVSQEDVCVRACVRACVRRTLTGLATSTQGRYWRRWLSSATYPRSPLCAGVRVCVCARVYARVCAHEFVRVRARV